MLLFPLQKNLPEMILASATAMVFATIMAAHSAVVQAKKWREEMAQSPLHHQVPLGAPPMTQESIDKALRLFKITVPPQINPPTLDLALADRGVTVLDGLQSTMKVQIGPGAFSSWSILGSTLAHELEVHCEQNFALIRFMDSLGLDGTRWAERQAYQHEIDHAKRFGLSEDEIFGITETMNFYYPHQHETESFVNKFSASMKELLAR